MNTAAPYRPESTVAGPAYSPWFKMLSTAITVMLALYGADIVRRFPIAQYGWGVKALLCCAAIMLMVSYYWFLRSATIVDDKGIRQTWVYDKRIDWQDVRGVKMIGIPYAGWLFPPRLVIRTGNAFVTFNGGSKPLLTEFAKVTLAFQLRR